MTSVIQSSRQVYCGRADSLSLSTLLDGEAVALSAASFIVYRGSEEIVSGNCTVVGNVSTVSFGASTFDVPAEYRLVLTTTRSTGGAVMVTQHLFWAVYHKLLPMVDDTVLMRRVPTLADDIWSGETNYQDQIDEAFSDILDDLWRSGYDSSVLVDAGQLNSALTWKSLAVIFWGFMRADGDVWDRRYQDAEKKYSDVMASIKLDIAPDYSGIPTREANMATIRMRR
ncbi:MAG TPA: hypothetical protein VLH56_11325 [Dissulfurispiraceae bacterium]|nr:hypothetical protein [Dissulfurispiraceae bacterium]